MRYSLNLMLPPTANHRLIPANGRLVTSPKMRKWKDYASNHVTEVVKALNLDEPVKGRVAVSLMIQWPDKRRRDIDGPVKPILDALVKGGLIEDDSNIKEFAAFIDDGVGDGGVGIEIDTME